VLPSIKFKGFFAARTIWSVHMLWLFITKLKKH
jgi:hypothetical protein